MWDLDPTVDRSPSIVAAVATGPRRLRVPPTRESKCSDEMERGQRRVAERRNMLLPAPIGNSTR